MATKGHVLFFFKKWKHDLAFKVCGSKKETFKALHGHFRSFSAQRSRSFRGIRKMIRAESSTLTEHHKRSMCITCLHCTWLQERWSHCFAFLCITSLVLIRGKEQQRHPTPTYPPKKPSLPTSPGISCTAYGNKCVSLAPLECRLTPW